MEKSPSTNKYSTPAAEEVAQEPAKEETAQEPPTEEDAQETATNKNTDESAVEEGTQKPAVKKGSRKSAAKKDEKTPTAKKNTKKASTKNIHSRKSAAKKDEKTPTAKKNTKKASTKNIHPSYAVMITESIAALNERSGSSRQAILKYIVSNYNQVDEKKAPKCLTRALNNGVSSGALKRVKGLGALGSFKITTKTDREAAARAKKKAEMEEVKPKNPYFSVMIHKALKGRRAGSSRQAIAKYIVENYNIADINVANKNLTKALKKAVAKGTIKQVSGTGGIGRFRVPTNPPYNDMISEAIIELDSKDGSSRQAIQKYIFGNYKIEDKKAACKRLTSVLKKMVAKGSLARVKGTGGLGIFRINNTTMKAAEKKRKPPSKTSKKPAAKKAKR